MWKVEITATKTIPLDDERTDCVRRTIEYDVKSRRDVFTQIGLSVKALVGGGFEEIEIEARADLSEEADE